MWRLTDEERELRERIRSVVLEQIRPRVREMDENCDYPHDVHETLAREGLMGLAFPAGYARQMAKQLAEREPVWPEIMPGARGVAVGAEA